MKSFENIVRNAEKRYPEGEITKEIKYVNQQIINMCLIAGDTIKVFMNMEKDKTFTEKDGQTYGYRVYEAVIREFEDMLKTLSDDAPCESEAHILNAYETLIYDSNLIKETYNKIKDTDISKKRRFQMNMQKNIEILAAQILDTYRGFKKRIPEEELEMYRAYFVNPRFKKFIQKEIGADAKDFKNRLIFGKDENMAFEEFLKGKNREVFEEIREKYIKTISEVGKQLEKYGIFQIYQEQMNSDMKKIGLSELNYDFSGEQKISDYFDEENLKKLPTQTLLGLCAFWINRLTKEVEKMNGALFICKDTETFEQISKQIIKEEEKVVIPLQDEDVRKELIKVAVIKAMNTIIIQEIEKEAEKRRNKDESTEYDIEPYLKRLCVEYQEQYQQYFDKLTPQSMNVLGEDIFGYITGQNIMVNLYKIKDCVQLALLEQAAMGKGINNWGYIEENKENRENYILIGFDVTGLNMPVRLHIKKEYLQEFLNANGMENKIPKYMGNEDFKVKGKYISAPIILALDKERIQKLNTLGKTFQANPDFSRYLSHSQYLINTTNENFPQHLKTIQTIGKGKKQKVKKVIEKTYVDIDTKKEYKMNNNGEYIEITGEKII